jgi:recombination protein RecA
MAAVKPKSAESKSSQRQANPADAKLKAIELAISGLERACGKGAVMRLTDRPAYKYDVIPSGSLAIDMALGVGGFPRGRIVELYGPESSGKTTLALHAIASAQKAGGYALLIDAEHAYDPAYGKKLGVDADRLYISQPDYGEQGLHIADTLISSGAVDLVVIDSVAALVPKAELEGDMGDSHVGLQARMMSQAMRKLTASANRTGTCIIFINQIREKIGVMFGSPETTPGGRALKFFASVRVEIRRTTQIKDGEASIGTGARVTIKKNKVAPPFRKCDIEIYFNKGISYVADMLGLGVELGIVTRSGNWYNFGDTRLGNGKAKTIETLEDPANAALLKQVDDAVKAVVFSEQGAALVGGGGDEAAAADADAA